MDMDMDMDMDMATIIDPNVGEGGTQNAFCNSNMSMDMLMSGFDWSWNSATSCAVFLFQNYEVNSVGLLCSTYFIALIMSLCVHLIAFLRMKVQNKLKCNQQSYWLRLLNSFLYTLQVGFGYLLMLIAMT